MKAAFPLSGFRAGDEPPPCFLVQGTKGKENHPYYGYYQNCLLYTSDAADE